jgi:uncharacterized protein YgbK (DUF1537 family)
LTGGSGIALGLADNFRAAGLLAPRQASAERVQGPAAALAGSCSARTLEQVAAHARRHPCLRVAVDDIVEGRVRPVDAAAFIAAHPDEPLVYTSAAPQDVQAAQQRFGGEKAAHAVEAFLAATAVEITRRGVRRLVVAGGETSGAVLTALGVDALRIGAEIDPGVPALFCGADPVLGLALKSGNFGAADFFTKAFAVLAGEPA